MCATKDTLKAVLQKDISYKKLVFTAWNIFANGGDGNHKHTREVFLDEDDEFAGQIPLDNGKDITLTQVQFEQVRRWVLNKYDGLDEWKK